MAQIRQQLVGGRRWSEAETALSTRDSLTLERGGRDGRRTDDRPQRAALITHTVEAEVIPRLLLSRRAAAPLRLATRVPQPGDVAALVRLVLAETLPDAERLVERLGRSGIGAESLYLDLLAPTARRLGEMWEEDLCSFVDVSIGLVRLHRMLRDLAPALRDGQDARAFGPRALLVPVPGEQHTFGLSMVVEFFRRAGWQVWSGAVANAGDLASLLRREWFDVVGISTGCGDRLEAMAGAVRAVRRTSLNPAVGIMVGGAIFNEHPELATSVGADATAVDGRHAVVQAQTLLTLLTDHG